jgi:hypothetical protein
VKYAVEMGSGAMIYIPYIGSGIQKLRGRGGYTDITELTQAYYQENMLKRSLNLTLCLKSGPLLQVLY